MEEIWNLSDSLPVRVFLGVVAAEAEIEVLADVAVDPAAYDQTLAVITSILHVHHLVLVLVAFRLGPACRGTISFSFDTDFDYNFNIIHADNWSHDFKTLSLLL